MITVTLALCVTLFAADAGAAEKGPAVRVYVYTAPSASGTQTDEEKGRLDAVRDIRDALRRKSGITLVDDRSLADVVVEITDREQRDAGGGGFGGKMITPLGDTIIRLHVTSGGHEAEIKGMAQGTWGRAAKDAADRLMKWIARNTDRPPQAPAHKTRRSVRSS